MSEDIKTETDEQLSETEHVKPIRKKRMTKNEVKQYIEWCFSPEIKDQIPNWKYKKIITEYEKLTGKKLSHQFIAAQRNKWQLINNEISRVNT